MKLMKYLFLFTLAFGVLSCSKDDDGPDPYLLTRTNFVGTYSLKALEKKEVETITFTNGSKSSSSTVVVGSVFQNVRYNFNADGTFSATGLYNTVETVTNADGSVVVNDPIIVNLDKSGTYTLDTTRKTVTVTYEDESQTTYDITLYKENEMKLFAEKEVVDGNSTTVTTENLGFTR